MKGFVLVTLASLALCGGGVCLAQADLKAPAKVTASKTVKKKAAAPAPAINQDEIQRLRDAFLALQQTTEQQLQSLKQENAILAEQLRQYQQEAEAAQITTDQIQHKVAALEEQNPAVTRLQTEVAAIKTKVITSNATVQKAAAIVQDGDKRFAALESPDAIHYKGVKLTPGGYLQFAEIYRTHNANSDTADSYGAFPLWGSANAKTSEFRISGRASRISLKAEGATRKVKMMGYVEVDFLGASPTSTEAQTNSYNPRLRLAFGEAKFSNGWTIAGGQNWSMLQTTKKGIDALSEWLPSLIDNSYTTGFSYAREGTIRVSKEIVPNKAWLGFSVENPETVANVGCVLASNTVGTSSVCPFNILNGAVQGTENTTLVSSPSNGFSTATSGTTLLSSPSNDIAPDLVAKFVVEPSWGHYEVKAIGRFFRDRVYPNYGYSSTNLGLGNNRVTEGGGIGIGAIMPVVAKKMDVEVQALAGKGIGRFGTTGGPDVTVNTKGDLVPIKGLQAIVGIETHPTPKFDFNFYAGDEYYERTTYSTAKGLFAYPTGGTFYIGYGAPQFLDLGCTEASSTTNLSTTCMTSSQNRNVWTAQPSMWYRIYKGKEGALQLGASYSYTYRRTWDGVNTTSSTTSSINTVRPLAIENIVMTSFRYYLP